MFVNMHTVEWKYLLFIQMEIFPLKIKNFTQETLSKPLIFGEPHAQNKCFPT